MNTETIGQTFEWANQTGNSDWDVASAIALDGSGNVYYTGIFRATVDFDPGPGVFNLTSQGTQDVFVSKLDAAGNFIWAKQLGGTGWKDCHAMTIDGNGDILITGFFLGPTDFDPAATTFVLNSSPGGDAFICKLDSSGQFVWAKQIGGNLAVTAYSIATDDSGNVYTTGFFDGTADFDPDAGTFYLTVVAYSDIFISKLDAAGNFIWAKQLGGSEGAVGYSITVDGSGNIYSTGTFAGTVDFDPGSGTYDLFTPSGQQQIYISKLDATGNFLWAKQMGGEVGYSIITDHTGMVYATGYYGWDDITINKLDPSGNVIWSKETGAFVAYSLAVDDDYNVYATGQFFGTRDFDPGPGTYNLTAIGSTDSYISKLDSSGNFIWTIQLGGTDEVKSRASALSSNGIIYTTGTFNGTADFDHSAANYNLTSSGSYDNFLHKLNVSTTDITENSFKDKIKVFPNPAGEYLVVEFEKEYKNLRFVLRNITGEITNTFFIKNSDRAEIQLMESSGIYFLEISDQKGQKAVIKIVKK